MSWLPAAPRILLILIGTWVFYDRVMTRCGNLIVPLARRLAAKGRIAGRFSVTEVDAIARLTSSTILQMALLACLAAITGINLVKLFVQNFDPSLIAYGLALGIFEMGVSSMVCFAAIRLAVGRRSRRETRDATWTSLTRAGWMRLFLRTAEAAPPAVSAGIIFVYIASEELVFRGVLVGYLQPFGMLVSVALPLTLFLAAQTFRMPSMQSAMFPLVGALVVGVTHSILFLLVPNIVPLIVAHLAFFAIAIL